jgi:O-antigen/teichoic acid export membrane protein
MASRYLFPLLNRPSSPQEKFVIFDLFRRRQLMVLIALAVPLVLFAKTALLVLFSSSFVGAAPWLSAFLIWQLLAIQTNVQLALLFALDELWIVTVKSIAGAALSALLCVLLIPSYGLSGGAMAMVAGTAVTLVIGAERLRRRGYVMEISSVLLGGYAVIALLLAPYAMHTSLWDSIPLKMVACLLLVGGLWPFLDNDEKAAVKRILRRPYVGGPAR